VEGFPMLQENSSDDLFGDCASFCMVFQKLVGQARRTVADEAAAEDVVQDVLVRTWPRIAQIRSVPHYLCRAVRLRALSSVRNEKRRRERYERYVNSRGGRRDGTN
jgi:DNA-directed RNA polymerase specialized sigma24 family protein